MFAATYTLPIGLVARVAGERVAVVDDLISAGSSVRAVLTELLSSGASVSVVGSLLVLGTKAIDYFASVDVPVVALERREFAAWLPGACPLCEGGIQLENPATP